MNEYQILRATVCLKGILNLSCMLRSESTWQQLWRKKIMSVKITMILYWLSHSLPNSYKNWPLLIHSCVPYKCRVYIGLGATPPPQSETFHCSDNSCDIHTAPTLWSSPLLFGAINAKKWPCQEKHTRALILNCDEEALGHTAHPSLFIM